MRFAFVFLFFFAVTITTLPAIAQMSAGEERATAFVAGQDAGDESLDATQKNLFFAGAAAFSFLIFAALWAARRSSDRCHKNLARIADELRTKGAEDV